MPFNLGDIPDELIYDVVSKMDLMSMTRVCQMSSRINDFVEKNHHRIKLRASYLSSILKISVDAKKMALAYEVAYWKSNHVELLMLSENLTIGRIPDPFTVYYRPVESPLESLPMAKFDFVFMHFSLQTLGKGLMENSENMKKQADVVKGILSQLDRIRLQCDWLCMQPSNSYWYIMHIVEDLLSKVNFKNFYFRTPSCFREVESWPIQHCDSIHLSGVMYVPKRIASLFKSSSVCSVDFSKQNSIEDMMSMIKNFILEMKENNSIVRNLKKLTVFYADLEKIEEIEFLEKIYEQQYDPVLLRNPLTISKLKLDRGFAYLTFQQGSYDFKFVDQECDEEIIAIAINEK